MAKRVYVTPAQVDAARLLIDLRTADGEPVSEALRKIANAQAMSPARPAGA